MKKPKIRKAKRDRFLHYLSAVTVLFPVLFYVLMNWSTARYGYLSGAFDINTLSETAQKLYTPLFAVNLIIILIFALTIVFAVLSLLYDNLLQFRLVSCGLLLMTSVSLVLEIAYMAMAIPSGMYESVCDILVSVFTLVYFVAYLVPWIFIIKKPYDRYLEEKYEEVKKETLAETEKKVESALHEEPEDEDATPEQRREKIKAMIELAREKNAVSQEEADALLSELEETKES